jgi:hypothetical protein
MRDFVRRAVAIREQMRTTSDLLTLCYIIAPDTERYLDEDVLAEFLLACADPGAPGAAGQRYTVGGGLLVGHVGCARLHNIVRQNVARAEKQQAAAEPVIERLANAAEARRATPAEIVACAAKGTTEAAALLMRAMEAPWRSNTLCNRRVRSLILRACPVGSVVEDMFRDFHTNHTLAEMRRQMPKPSHYITRLLRDATAQPQPQRLALPTEITGAEAAAVAAVQDATVEDATLPTVQFVPSSISRVRASAVTRVITAVVEDGPECPVCFEASETQLETLHNERRHQVCRTCLGMLRREEEPACPFCRADIS